MARKMIRHVEPTEHQIQSAIVEWANITSCGYCYRKIGHYLFSIPNGGLRCIKTAKRLKKEGLKSGVSDLFLAFPSWDWRGIKNKHGLFIEVKSTNGKISLLQKEFMKRMDEVKYHTVIVKSVDEGIQAIKDYLGME